MTLRMLWGQIDISLAPASSYFILALELALVIRSMEAHRLHHLPTWMAASGARHS